MSIKIFKQLEQWNKRIWYALFARMFHNQQIELPLSLATTRKVLVFRYDRIGDMVVSLPALRFLAEDCKLEVHVLCSKNNERLLDDADFIHQRHLLEKGFWSHLKAIRHLRQYKFDTILCFVFHHSTYSGLLSNFIGPTSIKVGRMYAERTELYSILFNAQVQLGTIKDAMVEYLLQFCCTTFGKDFRDAHFNTALPLHLKRVEQAEKLVAQLPKKKLVVLNVSAGTTERNFSVELSRGILDGLHELLPDVHIVVTGVARDAESIQRIVQAKEEFATAMYSFSHILDMAAFISSASLLISPDTSVPHLADAQLVPTVVSHLHENRNWYPFFSPHRVILCPVVDDFSSLSVSLFMEQIHSLASELNLVTNHAS